MQAETTAADSLEAVTETLETTIVGVWTDFVAHLPYLAAGVVVLLFTWVVVALFRRLSGRLFRSSKLRRSLQDLLVRLSTIGIWTVGLLLSAMVVFPGLTPTRALGGLGVVSLAVGFAFKDIFENFFAGILILWRFPFEVGDFIQCEGIEGRVEDVTIRMTVIRRVTGELVVVPNGFLFKSPVEVLTDPQKRRITVMAGVAYGEDVAEAVRVIEGAVAACSTVDPDRPVEIFPQAFGASSIDIEVTWWADPRPLEVRRSRGEVVTAVKKALDDAGIEIPFPYRTLTFKEPLPVAHEEGSR